MIPASVDSYQFPAANLSLLMAEPPADNRGLIRPGNEMQERLRNALGAGLIKHSFAVRAVGRDRVAVEGDPLIHILQVWLGNPSHLAA